jgi:hypothetical protein
MYVCVYGYAPMYVYSYALTCVSTYVCVYDYICVCMYVCMYVSLSHKCNKAHHISPTTTYCLTAVKIMKTHYTSIQYKCALSTLK